MKNKNLKLLLLFFFSLMMQSCKNYYYLKHTAPVSNEDQNFIHNLKFSDESISFVTYSDYHINTVDKKSIFFKNRDMNHLLKMSFQKPVTQQFLFMYTKMSIYNNLLGFYYKGTSLDEVMKNYAQNPDVNLGNGVLYSYNFGKFNVVDIYRKSNNGVIRFINLNNPKEKDSANTRFHLEVNKLFFELNENLWDKTSINFQ